MMSNYIWEKRKKLELFTSSAKAKAHSLYMDEEAEEKVTDLRRKLPSTPGSNKTSAAKSTHQRSQNEDKVLTNMKSKILTHLQPKPRSKANFKRTIKQRIGIPEGKVQRVFSHEHKKKPRYHSSSNSISENSGNKDMTNFKRTITTKSTSRSEKGGSAIFSKRLKEIIDMDGHRNNQRFLKSKANKGASVLLSRRIVRNTSPSSSGSSNESQSEDDHPTAKKNTRQPASRPTHAKRQVTSKTSIVRRLARKDGSQSSSSDSSDSEGPPQKSEVKMKVVARQKAKSNAAKSESESESESTSGSDSSSSSDSVEAGSKSQLYSDCCTPPIDRRIALPKRKTARSLQSASDRFKATAPQSWDRRRSLGTPMKHRLDLEKRKRAHETTKNDLSSSFNTYTASKSTSLFTRELKYPIHEQWADERLEEARNAVCDLAQSDVPFVDTHCHIDFLFKRLPYSKTYDDYINEAFVKFPKNFEGCIADWCQPDLYRRSSAVLDRHYDNCELWGAFGCHPHFSPQYNIQVESEIRDRITGDENVIAIGEMGLDYSDRFGPTDHELQKKVFIKQLKLASRLSVPIVIHCRDADPDLLDIMKQYVPHDTKIHRHCLTVGEKTVGPLLDHFPNCHVGFTNLLSNKSAAGARQAAKSIPLDRILLETDSPYFIPRCVSETSNGAVKWSHSGMGLCVAKEIASLKNCSVNDVLTQVRKNVTAVYGI